MLESVLNGLAKVKMYFVNASLYMAIMNFIMVLASFKLLYKVNVTVWIVVPVGFLLVLLIGYLDYRFVYLRQVSYANKKNDMKAQMDRIEKKLDEVNAK